MNETDESLGALLKRARSIFKKRKKPQGSTGSHAKATDKRGGSYSRKLRVAMERKAKSFKESFQELAGIDSHVVLSLSHLIEQTNDSFLLADQLGNYSTYEDRIKKIRLALHSLFTTLADKQGVKEDVEAAMDFAKRVQADVEHVQAMLDDLWKTAHSGEKSYPELKETKFGVAVSNVVNAVSSLKNSARYFSDTMRKLKSGREW